MTINMSVDCFDRHPGAPDFLGELGHGGLDFVLHLHLGDVQVGTDLKRRHQRQLPVVGVQRIKVNLILHPIELLLDGCRPPGLFHHVSAGTQVGAPSI